MTTTRNDLRNVAIIAHVDHGKTTLVDGLLRQAEVFRENERVAERVMDSNDLERERGITILAKNTAIAISHPETGEQVKINIVDTPGHADFGGEVERVLNMVDGVLLLVDAAEGPRPQTRFVLKKALELGHRAIVVINKIDRKDADPTRVLNETFDLFLELGATDEQAEFPVVYTIATTAQAGYEPEVGADLAPLFETILAEVPPPSVEMDGPTQMLVTSLYYDRYKGLAAVGRLNMGSVKVGQTLTRITRDGEHLAEKVQYLHAFDGLARVDIEVATAGDIIAIAGLENIQIGETLADPEDPIALPTIEVEEPTVRMTFGVNTSPFAGKDGKYVTSRRIRDRLFNELRQNVAMRVEETASPDEFLVSGRGELHLAILIETMRREGYEFQVSRPEVIMHKNEEGETVEPFEQAEIEVPPDAVGSVVEMLGKRKGEMIIMEDTQTGYTRMVYNAPTRGLLGFRHHFLTATRGLGIMNTMFAGYRPLAGLINSRSTDSLVAHEAGTTTAYGLANSEPRGILFVGPGVEVYRGMVVGEHQRPGDLDVNVCKKKNLTNMRNAIRDIDVRLTPPREMSLDESIEYLSDDELLEVTPNFLRIRKRDLDPHVRARKTKRAKEAMAS